MPQPSSEDALDIRRVRVRLRLVSEADQARPEMAVLLEQLSNGAVSWAEPAIPSLLSWIRAGSRRSELQALLRDTASRLHTLSPAHARPLIELLTDFELISAAYALSTLPQLARDPQISSLRARLAMHQREYASAIAASEVAITALLQPGVSIAELLRLCAAGAPAEGLLRFERHVLADRAHLSEQLALYWEALHRAGRSRDASLMQLMCQRYFPERASVWATAGNHALDGDDLGSAEKYFQRCLQLDADWTAALAGLAIVRERQKDWARALGYRRRVLELERALERDDAASLHRRLRYAAALARLGQWRDAEPLFRSAVCSPNIAELPAEHPVLLRVFSQELYSPALVSRLRRVARDPSGQGPEPAVALAQHEAVLLQQLGLQLSAAKLKAADERWAHALVAYLSGELERAYDLFDRSELDRPDDVAVHHLLCCCARAIGHAQAVSIRAFAEEAAQALWAARASAAPSPAQLGYTIAILPELAPLALAAGYTLPGEALDELDPMEAPMLAQLERIAAFRAIQQAAGRSPLVAAAASTQALAALVANADL